jgi:putative endonuclease
MASKPYYVYMLLCADQSIYTGLTTDIERRLIEHNAGKGARYTAPRIPVVVLAVWECENRSAATKLELKFKGMTRVRKLEMARTTANQQFLNVI